MEDPGDNGTYSPFMSGRRHNLGFAVRNLVYRDTAITRLHVAVINDEAQR